MVRSSELTPQAITQAMDRGDFYASSGVILQTVEVKEKEYKVVVDERASAAEMSKDELAWRRVNGSGARLGYRIDFIGSEGKVLMSVQGPAATFHAEGKLPYVRAKVTYTRDFQGDVVECAAWTQPAFRDGRFKANTR
jgi:hypothetical protein